MEQEPPPNGDDVRTPVAVGLVEAPLDQVHDGRVLAAYLEDRGERCIVQQMTSVTSAVAAEQLASTGARSFFVAVGRENLKAVLGVVKMLGASASVFLFGRELSDADLRRKIPAGAAADVLVGEPWEQALSRLRSWRAGAAVGAPAALRAPRRGLDDLPPGRYGLGEPQVAEIVPVHTSRSSPHACLFSAERAWEQPVRRRSAGAIVEELGHLVEACGARHFAFTDLVANTDSDALIEVAEGILARRLELRWHARISARSAPRPGGRTSAAPERLPKSGAADLLGLGAAQRGAADGGRSGGGRCAGSQLHRGGDPGARPSGAGPPGRDRRGPDRDPGLALPDAGFCSTG